MIKFRVVGGDIAAREISKETKTQVVVPANRYRGAYKEAKRSKHQNWFDTWEEAHSHAIAAAQEYVDSLRVQLKRAEGRLGQIKGMKRPEVGR